MSYSIWVLEYCYIPQLPIGVQIYGANNEGVRKCPFCYVVIKGHNTVAMVDVGVNFDEHGATMAAQFGLEGFRPPKDVLAECGIKPEDVQHVFVTHAHFDHMGATEAFPDATFYIQERELSKWIWAMSLGKRFRWLMGATDPGDILRAIGLARQGRLKCLDGELENVLPGIDLCAAFDTHTWGSMFVNIRNDGVANSRDAWVFAGDVIYCFENVRGRDASDPQYIPVGLAVGSQTELLMATDRMVNLVGGDLRRVVPVHEDRLGDEFPFRITVAGLRVYEISLAAGEQSRVHR